MDIPRTPPNRTRRRLLVGGGATLAIALVTVGLARLKPAAPQVEKGTLWIDTVRRGDFVREVRGNGTLVPIDIRWISAASEGRIERLLLQPGAAVEPDSVILELTNPELEVSARDAEFQERAAEADLAALRVRLESTKLDQKAQAASVDADYQQARLEAEANEQLAKEGLVSALQLKISRVRAEELKTRTDLETQRLTGGEASIQAQLAAQQARVDQLRELHRLRAGEVEALKVRAGLAGVLQQLPVEVGQRVTPGTTLARVARPEPLKAELKIAETQARDVLLGQPAKIDTRNGVVEGKVLRIDPAVQNGTVTVDVQLLGTLPKGARPDLSVDGTIELEHLSDVLFVGRPAFGQPESTVTLFRVGADGDDAARVQVKLGRGSVHLIEVQSGLAEGDRVILSDMSTWDAFDRVRLE
ncbi:MAG: HlyD family efflux transporter periplasmic adaptor subunit [Thermoanaerobaculia bacterium]